MPRPDLLPADLADERIRELEEDLTTAELAYLELRGEKERLQSKLMPMQFITAQEAIKYLESFILRLDSAHERRSVEITVLAIKRLSSNPNATIEGKP